MTAKLKKPAAAPKTAPKASAKPAKATKGAKVEVETEIVIAVAAAGEGEVDQDELEEQEEARAAATSSKGGEAAAAMAAMSATGEQSTSFKNFRNHPDMENFYRFIYENDLRHEALSIIDVITTEKRNRRQLKAAKALAH